MGYSEKVKTMDNQTEENTNHNSTLSNNLVFWTLWCLVFPKFYDGFTKMEDVPTQHTVLEPAF